MGQTNDKPKSSRPGRGAGRSTAPRFNDARFVQFELDRDQQATCKGWAFTSDDAWAEVTRLVDSGYSVAVKWDERNEVYACFIQNRDLQTGPNKGLILTGRGSTAVKAVKQAVFKDRLMDQDWSAYGERPTFQNLDD